MQAIQEGLLKVHPGLFLWTAITFIILLLILWKAAWRPIVDALDARAEKIRGDIDGAEKARFEAEKVMADYKEMMANVRNESAQLIAKSREEAEKIKSDILEKAARDASEVTEKTKRDIDAAKDRALADIKAEIVVFSTEIASKIIGKNINSNDQKSLAEEVFNKMRTVQ